MALRKSPTRTLAFLAANRANALKSTGPRTPQGKARSCLNALKDGRYARNLSRRLARAGERSSAELLVRMRSAICAGFGGATPSGRLRAESLASQVWCRARVAWGSGTKPATNQWRVKGRGGTQNKPIAH